jgi:hypothetical protein
VADTRRQEMLCIGYVAKVKQGSFLGWIKLVQTLLLHRADKLIQEKVLRSCFPTIFVERNSTSAQGEGKLTVPYCGYQHNRDKLCFASPPFFGYIHCGTCVLLPACRVISMNRAPHVTMTSGECVQMKRS